MNTPSGRPPHTAARSAAESLSGVQKSDGTRSRRCDIMYLQLTKTWVLCAADGHCPAVQRQHSWLPAPVRLDQGTHLAHAQPPWRPRRDHHCRLKQHLGGVRQPVDVCWSRPPATWPPCMLPRPVQMETSRVYCSCTPPESGVSAVCGIEGQKKKKGKSTASCRAPA